MRKRSLFGAVAVAVMLGGVVVGAGPAAASTATLSKTSDLAFYERVTVHTGQPSGAPVRIDQCFIVNSVANCAPLADTNVPVNGDVTVVLTRRIEGVAAADGTASFIDCTAAGVMCQVFVFTATGNTAVPVAFDPAAPVPALSVTPNSNLGWSTDATAHGSGFLPDQTLMVTQCAHVAGSPVPRCLGVVNEPRVIADSTGAFTIPVKIRRLMPSHFDPTRDYVDCARVDCFVRAVLPPINREDRNLLYRTGPVDTAVLQVRDDGIPIVLMRKTFGQNEQHPVVNINVDLTEPARAPFTITYNTGTALDSPYAPATAGSDYVAKLNHHLYFLPGETHHQISISILDDTIPEPVEAFAVNLSGYFHANTRTTTVGIGDNDR